MDSEVALVDDCAQGKAREQINEIVIDLRLILDLTLISNILHYYLKLNEVVMTFPSWLPLNKCID